MKKIEIDILSIILIEAVFLLFLFKDNFANLLIGTVIGLLLIYLAKKIKNNNITRLILLIISIVSFIIVLYNITLFINYNILKKYSLITIAISILVVSFFLAKSYHSFIKTTEIFFYLILFLKLIAFILTIPLIDLNNFNYQFHVDYHFINISIIIFLLYKNLFYLTDYKIGNKTIGLSLLNSFFIKIMSILILGNSLSRIYQYPYINYLKEIKYLNFIERMDGILSFEYILCFFTLESFIILTIKNLKKQ